MVLKQAKEVILEEAKAIRALANSLDQNFVKVVSLILRCKGRIVVTGMGKSGLIGRKIAATLSSTGTPSFFLHPAEGIHGDLGMVREEDIVLALSYSGETSEILNLLPSLKKIGSKVISITGNPNSSLAKASEVHLDLGVRKEACPLGLAPTTSTTATLVLGDALAIALMQKRGFKAEDFALFHPGGSLGKRLLSWVKDFMHSGEENPIIEEHKSLKEALITISSKRLGAVSVVNKEGTLVGIITDGDVRRLMERAQGSLAQLFLKDVKEVMTSTPKFTRPEELASNALKLMEDKAITVLPVLDNKNRPIGMVHIHDLVKAGITYKK